MYRHVIKEEEPLVPKLLNCAVGSVGPLTFSVAKLVNPALALAALRSEFAGHCRLVAAHYQAMTGRPDPFLKWLAGSRLCLAGIFRSVGSAEIPQHDAPDIVPNRI